MGSGFDGKIQDFVIGNIISALIFEPKGTKKTIEEITREMAGSGNEKFYQKVADHLVAERFIYKEIDKSFYVISKNKKNEYFFKPATKFDRIMNYIINFPSI
jgi:hypothetical protein